MSLFLIGMALFSLPSRSAAAPQAEAEAEELPNYAALQEESREQIARVKAEIKTLQGAMIAVPVLLAEELELWQQSELVTQERRSAQEELARTRNSRHADPFGDGLLRTPRSYLDLDDLRSILVLRERDLDGLQMELQSEKTLAKEARDAFESAEQKRRRIHEKLKESVAGEKLDLQRQQAVAKLESRVLESRLELHREQSSLFAMRIEEAESEIAVIGNVLIANAGKFQLTRAELAQRLKFIEEQEAEVRAQLTAIETRMRIILRDQKAMNDPSISGIYSVAHEESQLLRQLLSGAGLFKECWRRRYLLSSGQASANDIENWLDEAEQTKRRITQIVQKLQTRTRQRQETLSLLHRSALLSDGDLVGSDVGTKRLELESIIGFYGGIQVLVTSGERLCDRLIEDLNARQSRFSFSENLKLLTSGIVEAWQYEIAIIDDEPITIKKIICGFALLLCGFFVSRMVASIVAFRVLPRFGVTESAAAVLRTILFYLLLIALVFISLDLVNVPLTIFAFLGGAVAIGVGFGSQNLINNFISGLILLVERPIRVGDLVNVEGIDANVEKIGARSTRVRTGTNLEIMVPNSKFLENNVTNWTLSDTKIRTSVSVGVAYGSPVREVVEVLQRVLRDTEEALVEPEPIVLFQDFADSSLNFEVHFWVHMRRIMDGAKIRSDVRVAIDDSFREQGISIAFPQRDVHIDMQSPLEVRLSEDNRGERPAARPRLHRRAA